ncbi:MAG: MFS transporter [Evtepia sp.]
MSILSLPLLTVMAGAAVAPAPGVIQAYFSGTSQTVVQLIISIPALFIVITNLCFPALSRRFSTKTLVLGGLLLYTVGGCAAGLFDQIALVLVMRALVGVGVGILMPLSTGLLTFYYPPERQAALMGYASAMNQMGGVIATLLAGLLSQLNWRASFLVYLLGLLSIVLCLGFLPSDRLDQPQHAEEANAAGSPFRTYFVYILSMFLLMSIFFVYPANFALETTAEGAVPAQCIAVIMAGADLVAFVGGLLFVHLRRAMGRGCKLLAPVLFLLGFLLLTLLGGWPGTLLGSACIGFANGVGIPFLISEASMQAGKSAASTVMPLLSAATYLAQFLSPLLLGALRGVLGDLSHLAYWFAVVLAVLFVLCSLRIPVGRGARRA